MDFLVFRCIKMQRYIPLFALVAAIAVNSVASAQVSKLLDRSGAIHDAAGAGNVVNSQDYYGSGNDDAFSEFGVAGFTYTPGDFGLSSVTGLTQFDYTITHNDRTFSDGTEFELFLATDDFDATYSSLSYDSALTNGLNTSQFANISSLGVFAYTPQAGGTQEMISFTPTGAQEADLLAEINAGSEFSIIIAATTADADVTFTGFDDTFEPGGQPVLTLNAIGAAVPEPSSIAILSLIGVAGFIRRRR